MGSASAGRFDPAGQLEGVSVVDWVFQTSVRNVKDSSENRMKHK